MCCEVRRSALPMVLDCLGGGSDPPAGMRRGRDGLAALIQGALGGNPSSGTCSPSAAPGEAQNSGAAPGCASYAKDASTAASRRRRLPTAQSISPQGTRRCSSKALTGVAPGAVGKANTSHRKVAAAAVHTGGSRVDFCRRLDLALPRIRCTAQVDGRGTAGRDRVADPHHRRAAPDAACLPDSTASLRPSVN